MRNVPDFVQLLKERNLPIEDMQMEVVEKFDGKEVYRGIITLLDEQHFTLEWKLWECFLSCIAHLRFREMLSLWPHCFGLRDDEVLKIDCEHAKRLQVIRTIQ